jgi:hypothetical protein
VPSHAASTTSTKAACGPRSPKHTTATRLSVLGSCAAGSPRTRPRGGVAVLARGLTRGPPCRSRRDRPHHQDRRCRDDHRPAGAQRHDQPGIVTDSAAIRRPGAGRRRARSSGVRRRQPSS